MFFSSALFVRSGRLALMIGMAGLALAGCGKQGDQAAAPKGQVIAHVGKDDITTQELDNEFRWAQIPADKRDAAAIKRVLGELVQRKFLVQKAMTSKLDREPGVLLDLLRAREQILATSFVQRDVSAKSTAIGKSDVDKFILGHPLMFDKRQVLTVDKISIPLTRESQRVVEATRTSKSLEEVEKKLTELGVLHNRSMGTISSSEIPEDFFNALKSQKPDDVFFVPAGGTGTFFKIKGQQNAPMPGEDANKLARQQLLMELLRAETGKQAASAQADVKYEGDYAKIMNETAGGAKK